MARLVTKDLSIGYGEIPVVDHLNIHIPEGEITAIIGPNGCGKSTLLKALTRILQPQSGSVFIDGHPLLAEGTKALARKMAILPQAPEVSAGLTVLELISYGRFPYQQGFGRLSKHDYEIMEWAMDVTGILPFKHRNITDLSGGQRQRVWIAMALAQETELIFLDEPTTYLDIAHQLEVLELLEHLNRTKGRTIVMVLHDLNQAARFADFIIAMKNGRIVKSGSSEEVITKPVLREVYGINGEIVPDPVTGKPLCLTYQLIKGDVKNEENMDYEHSSLCANY